jgi:hypothetical protein
LLKEKGLAVPEDFEELRFLTPFAVAFRYELYEEEEESFDSERVATLLAQLQQWTIRNLPPPNDEETTASREKESPDGGE